MALATQRTVPRSDYCLLAVTRSRLVRLPALEDQNWRRPSMSSRAGLWRSLHMTAGAHHTGISLELRREEPTSNKGGRRHGTPKLYLYLHVAPFALIAAISGLLMGFALHSQTPEMLASCGREIVSYLERALLRIMKLPKSFAHG